MILIDASNITVGGGKVLLEYLVEYLRRFNYKFIVIRNKKFVFSEPGDSNSGLFAECSGPLQRKGILKQLIKASNPSSLLCFGNYPPPVRLKMKTIIYFHNPHLIRNPLHYIFSDPLLILRKYYLRKYLMNSDSVIFQSLLIKNLFAREYANSAKLNLMVLPFYHEDKIKKHVSSSEKRDQFIYTSLPYKHKNHKLLLESWEILATRKLYPELLLTVPAMKANKHLLDNINEINSKGGRIINLGAVNYDEALTHTSKSKFAIFPSLDETFGLGLVEAAILGCYVIAADLPYVYESIKPSFVFNPSDAEGIADLLERIIKSETILVKTELMVTNEIEKLVRILT